MEQLSQEPLGEQDEWEFFCSAEEFDAFRNDPAFAQLLALARLLNVLRYVQSGWARMPEAEPDATRQRFNAFLIMGALLFEGRLLVNRMGRNYQDLPSWRETFPIVLRNTKFRSLLDDFETARNRAIFHFDESEFAAQAAQWPHDGKDVRFSHGIGRSVQGTYHELADSMAMQALFGPATDEAEWRARARILVHTASDFTVAFLRSADLAVSEALLGKGFKIRRVEAKEETDPGSIHTK